jgi:hypothetical protein
MAISFRPALWTLVHSLREWQGGHRREVGEELIADDFVDRAQGTGSDVSKKNPLDWWTARFGLPDSLPRSRSWWPREISWPR